MYIVTYKGRFAFIKPWTAVRDGETFSQQFLTPSIIEGIEKKLFPEMLKEVGIHKILRHKLSYDCMDLQQEVTQSRGWKSIQIRKAVAPHDTSLKEIHIEKQKGFTRETSILKRNVLLNPSLILAFTSAEDAEHAAKQHICLCTLQDILLPLPNVLEISETEFNQLKGFEFRIGKTIQSFMVGFNRYQKCQPMNGWLEINGQSLTNE